MGVDSHKKEEKLDKDDKEELKSILQRKTLVENGIKPKNENQRKKLLADLDDWFKKAAFLFNRLKEGEE